MGFMEFVILCFVVLAIAAIATWCIRTFIPETPPYIYRIIWGVAAGIIVVTLLKAMGVWGHDPQIPHL